MPISFPDRITDREGVVHECVILSIDHWEHTVLYRDFLGKHVAPLIDTLQITESGVITYQRKEFTNE